MTKSLLNQVGFPQSNESSLMATQPLPLSQETLAQFNHSLAVESESGAPQRCRLGSVSTRRSSRDQLHEHLQTRALHRMGSVCGSHAEASFHRRDSVSTVKRLWQQGGRVSFSGLQLQQPIQEEVHMENTYRMGPEPHGCFSGRRTQQILQATLDGFLTRVSYSPANCDQLSRTLSELLCSKLKDINPPRYKLVCQVVLGQRGQQGLRVASRGLFNTQTDDYATAVFQNHSLFTVAIVYGIYHE